MDRTNLLKEKEEKEEEKIPNENKSKDEILGNESDEDVSPLKNMTKEEQRKMHEKMLEDDLKGLESKLTQQFYLDRKFIQDQINQPIEPVKPKSLPKKLKIKNIPEGALPHTFKMEQLTRKLDEEYYNGIKQTNKIPKNSKKLFEELESLKQKVNDIKQVNRDEELLRMQKENQEIEEKLNQLKQQDNTELKEKQENCRKLVEQLNVLFNERKKDAAEKEKEREEAIAQIKKIKQEQEKHKKEIDDLTAKKEELTQMLQNLEKDVESYNIYKKFIEQVNAKYSNDTTNQNDLYDNLKEKFEQLMNHEIEIQKNIADSEKEKEEIRKQIQEMRRKNDKQSQNTRLQELENEIKEYTDKNKQLEQEIDSILKEKQKKDSDTHQIKLSIFNLYDKVMKDDGKIEKNDNLYNQLLNEGYIDLDKVDETSNKIILQKEKEDMIEMSKVM